MEVLQSEMRSDAEKAETEDDSRGEGIPQQAYESLSQASNDNESRGSN